MEQILSLFASFLGEMMFLKSCYKIKSALLLFLFISVCCFVLASTPQERENSVTVIANPGTDGCAKIGSQIQASIIFTSNEQNTAAAVDFMGITNPGEDQLTLQQLNNSELYIGITNAAGGNALTVVPGNIDGKVSGTFVLTNASGTVEVTSVQFDVDNEPPLRNDSLKCTVNGVDYTSGVALRSGQVATLTQKVTSTDIALVQVDLSDLGLGTYTMDLKSGSTDTYITTLTIPDNYNTVCTCNVTLVDDAGNSTTYSGLDTLRITVDSRAPNFVINQTTITSSNNDPTVARQGNTLTFTAVIENYDYDSVTVTCNQIQNSSEHGSEIKALFPVELVINGTPTEGANATFLGNIVLPTDATVYYDNTLTFQFTATDNAGNSITREFTYAGIVDLGDFTFNSANVKIFSENNVGTSVATLTSKLYFTADILTTSRESTTVLVDLQPIGVVASMSLLYNEDLGLYIATYSGTLSAREIDGEYISFVVTATDKYNNTLTRTTPAILIDSLPPQINATTITSSNLNPDLARPDDTLTFAVTLNKYDYDTVEVTCSELLINHNDIFNSLLPKSLSVDANPSAGTNATFRGGIILPTSPITCYYAGNLSFQVTVTDDSGNAITREFTYTGTLDLSEFSNRSAGVKIYSDNNVETQVATASSQLYFYAEVSSAATSSTKVEVDLTPIGVASLTLNYNEDLNLYIATYSSGISTEAVQLDGQYVSFVVTATDLHGNMLQRFTTPSIIIDNVPPRIDSFTITGATGTDGSIINKDVLTMLASVSGANKIPDAVSINLTTLDNSGTHLFVNSSGDQWRYTHNVATGSIDGDYDFVLEAQDNHGNNTKTTLTLKVDNEPPIWISQQSYSDRYGLLNNDSSDPFIIIGDSVTMEVNLANSDIAGDGITIVIDLSELGNYGQVNMSNAGSTFNYSFDVATGSINHGAIFPMTILDGAGNTVIDQATGEPFVASFSFPTLDQNPPDPQEVTITLTNHTGTLDKFPLSINTKKTIDFRLPFIRETTYDDSATATLDVTYLCKLTDGTMHYIDQDLNAITLPTTSNMISMDKSSDYYHVSIVATGEVGLLEQSDYTFKLVMYDLSGNKVNVESQVFPKIDLNPPVIKSITIGTPGGGTILKIGDTFTIKVDVEGNDGNPPTIDLSSLDSSLGQAIMSLGTDGKYFYDATIAAGELDNLVASWAITVTDGCDNTITSYTTELTIDNKPPEVISFLVTADNITNHQRINYTDNSIELVTFVLESSEQLTNVSIDLSAIGRSSAAVPIESTLGLNYIYTIATTSLRTSEEYEDYRFPAIISDNHGNSTTVYSQAITKVDCEIPIITSSLCGVEITSRSDSLLPPQNSSIVRVGDTITFYASMTSGLDATASVTFSVDPGVASISKEMTLNEDKHRLEASFIIKAPGTSDSGSIWGSLNLTNLDYTITASDDVANIATPTSGITSFVVKNVIPTIASYSLTIDPDYDLVGTLNIASGTNRTNRDLLIASATLDNNAIIATATLDLTSIGGPNNFKLASITNSIVNNTGSGLDVALYLKTDYTIISIPITISDEAGYTCEATHELKLDTKELEITDATFDGEKIIITFSEDYTIGDKSQWSLIGSETLSLGGTKKLDLSDVTLVSNWDDASSFYKVEITLSTDGRKEVTKWASSPLYIEVTRDTTNAAATDLYKNWIASYSAFPITLTDSSWREPPQIVSFSMTHNWPESIFFNIEFSQDMDPTTLVASDAVIFINEPANITEFQDVAYDSWYVIQKNDNCSWTDSKTLKITLCDSGRDWIANKLTSNTDITLKFAQKSSLNKMVSSVFGKNLKLYTIESPFVIADNRSTTAIPALNVLSDPTPVINIVSARLTLSFNDRIWLFSDNYRTINETDPLMGMPNITNQNGSNLHLNKITLFNLNNNETIQLECASITTTLNEYASTTVKVNLTENDVANILNYYNTSSTTYWGLQVEANSFINMWGIGNTKYKPTSPGNVDVVESAPDVMPSILAVSVSDMPPTKDDVGNFTFDFELDKFKAGETTIPFSTTNVPTAAIFEISSGDRIASATFVSWNTRTVRDVERTIATFKTSESFTKNVNGVEAELRIYGLQDVFGNEAPVLIASYVYNVNDRSETALTGFSTASEAFIIDNVAPTVTDYGLKLIGLMGAGRDDFFVDYSETMDSESIPSLALATGTTTIGFTFNRWENTNTRAIFTIDEPITASTINGTWTYQISGGQDLANNAFVSSTTLTLIKSEIPKIVANSMQLHSIRNTIDINNPVVNKPLNFDISPDYTEISFKYVNANTDNLPHTMCFYDASDVQIGSATIVQNGVNATATISVGNFSSIPTTNTTINVKVIDIAENLTDVIGSIDYYTIAPNVQTMTLTGAATLSQGIYYYRTDLDNMSFRAVLNGNYNNPLNLLVASYAMPMSTVATMTISTNNPSGSIYTDILGTNLNEDMYIIMLADEAGNLHANAAPLMLKVDNTPPTIESITPGPEDRISNSAAGMATFTVKFTELMDTSIPPTLYLATTTLYTSIEMKFIGWGDDMMTASFTNVVPINATIPVGTYTYQVYEAKDLAGNLITSTPATCTTDVEPVGPNVIGLTILTLQPDIYDEALENRPYNPQKYISAESASVTFKLDYSTDPVNTPHKLLVYNESDENVATITVSAENPGYAIWHVSDDVPYADAIFKFKIIDDLYNCTPETGYLKWTFETDITQPDITSINFDDGDIGQIVDGIKYYSTSNPATFTVTTEENKDLILIASSTATTTYSIPATAAYIISFGQEFTDGKYNLKVSDLAGNINDTASISIIVDSIPPNTVAYASDELYNPISTVSKTATIMVIFDEIMNTNINPIVQLATDSGEVATLTFEAWIDNQRCTYITGNVFDSIEFPVGTASIVVGGAQDLARNSIATGTYGEVEVISESPSFTTTLTTKQTIISDESLTNAPFSFRVEPYVATLTIEYATGKGPYALDHTLLLYNDEGNQIATHTLTGGATEITVDEAFFGDFTTSIASPIEYTGTFKIELKDAVGNIASDSNNFVINYDSISPKVTNLTFDGVSTATTELFFYYNPDVLGSLTATINLNASDAIKLVVLGVSSSTADIIATRTYSMDLSGSYNYIYNGELDSNATELPEGTYKLAAIDLAGNISVLSTDNSIMASTTLLIDKTPPNILVATLTDQLYLNSGEAGMATFSIQFDETLFDKAYQYIELATTSYKIPCRLVRIETTAIASDTAIFETAVAVQNMIPQGKYVYHIIGTDLTGNRVETDFGEISVKSGGPIISSIKTFSYQQTTASATLESGEEFHYDDIFSFNVYPNAATMSIALSEEPDGDPAKVYVNFFRKEVVNQISQEILVASHAIDVDTNLMATFTWDNATDPIVTGSATYIIRIADTNNDLSYTSYTWKVDNIAPTYTDLSMNGGVDFPASGVVYLNPYRHTSFEFIFKNIVETNNPKLRVRSNISTDTYELTYSSNIWKSLFRGKYSRDTGNPDDLMKDGKYDIGLVDQAGNLAASGTENLYQMIIDTQNPVIGTYTLKINGITVGGYCAPDETRPLIISLETDEPLTATGAYYVDVYNSGGVRINRLNLVDNSGTLEASWNAKDNSGNTVTDGNYTFKVSDICGNTSTNATSTSAITSPFQVMPPAVQTGSNTVKVWLNHPIEPTSLGANPIITTPTLTISNIQIEDERALTFTSSGMTHGASYTVFVNTDIRNLYGATLTTTASSAIFYADTKGPAITGTSFENVNTQSDIVINFDQILDKTSAEDTSSYIVTDAFGNTIPISKVIIQSDDSSVMLCASGTFIENDTYIVKAPGVKDELGNNACETSLTGISFKGRDVTPPEFVISAFSNAANENDIIVVAVSNEELIREPTLTILHGTASPKTLTMQKNSTNPLAFMAAASLKSSNGTSGTLKIDGEDLSGNKGSGTSGFAIATVAPNSSARLSSTDDQLRLIFEENSLKSKATVKILSRAIIKDENASGTIQTALQNEYNTMRGVRASATSSDEEATNSELTPITNAYEVSIQSSKVKKGIIAALKVPETASQTPGLGLFYQKNGSWKFISANISSEKDIKARITSNQIFAIMQDTVAPTIKLDESMDLSKAFETARPEFIGNIKDFGSGVDTTSLEAKIDSNIQNLSIDNDGNFKFKSLSELINGNHDLTIIAKDRTGNSTTTGSMRFALVLPFEFKQIIQYPNPARNNVTIRIRTNSTGVNCNIRVKIYDVAGHKVADFDENDVRDKGDGNYELRWDLCNKKGKKVANGVYIARLEANNPETGKKVKSTLKIAVLK